MVTYQNITVVTLLNHRKCDLTISHYFSVFRDYPHNLLDYLQWLFPRKLLPYFVFPLAYCLTTIAAIASNCTSFLPLQLGFSR